jgi:protein required for attachment to host cells
MLKTCVIVADRARARLFVTAAPAERFVGAALVELQELEDLIDPEGELTGNELFSSSRSGTNRSPHGANFEYDDHRERHREEVERRFAKRIALATKQLLARESASRLVLAVEPHMLGILRQELGDTLPGVASRLELAENLSWHTPRHILETLEHRGVLSPTGT